MSPAKGEKKKEIVPKHSLLLGIVEIFPSLILKAESIMLGGEQWASVISGCHLKDMR